MPFDASLRFALPDDHEQAALVGRVWRPDVAGPSVVAVRGVELVDILPPRRRPCATSARRPMPAALAHDAEGEPIGLLADILANTPRAKRDPKKPWLLAPTDLQAIKAAGVTFAVSMLERVIEEKARGAPDQASGDPQGNRRAHRRRSQPPETGFARGDGAEEAAHRERHVVAISRSRHRAGRGGVHQGAGDGRRRSSRRGRRLSGFELEQPRAGDRA